jgi:hypothetical protein
VIVTHPAQSEGVPLIGAIALSVLLAAGFVYGMYRLRIRTRVDRRNFELARANSIAIYHEQMQRWDSSFVCKACGTVFLP